MHIYLFSSNCSNSNFQFLTEQIFDKNITLNKYWILILKQFSCVSLCSVALSQGENLEDYWQVIIRFIFIKTNMNLFKLVAKMHDKLFFPHYLHCTADQCWRPGFPKAVYSTGNTSRKNLLYEPAHEIMALFVLRILIFHTRMRCHQDVWFLGGPFVYFHTLCVRTAKALARLHECASSPEPSLVAYVITIISWAGSYCFCPGCPSIRPAVCPSPNCVRSVTWKPFKTSSWNFSHHTSININQHWTMCRAQEP